MSKLPDDVAIRVHDIHKDFHLPHNNEDSIKHKIITIFEKKDKEVDTQHALRGITVDIKKGEFFGILGRNGSGKSTLLKIISQIYMPTSGYVQHRGSLVAFIELGVGFNPQLTGRENVYLNASLLGFSRKEIDAFYDDVIAFSELDNHMEQKLKNYSSGMKVRLAFAVAIQAHADILVLDEVLAVGDADFQRKCYNYFKELKEEHKTIIFVSHSMGLVKEYCDRAILIENGRIAFEGNAEDTAYEYLRLFNKPQYEKEMEAKKLVNQNSDRWGSNEVTFTNITADVSEQSVVITCTLKNGSKPLDNIIIGLDIYNEKKNLAGGVDDAAQAANKFKLSPGEQKTIEFVFDNIFGGGKYMATMALKSQDGSYIYDHWKSAVSFTNNYQLDSYFPVRIPVTIAEK